MAVHEVQISKAMTWSICAARDGDNKNNKPKHSVLPRNSAGLWAGVSDAEVSVATTEVAGQMLMLHVSCHNVNNWYSQQYMVGACCKTNIWM